VDYWFEKTTPANTAKKDALKTTLKLSAGVITHVWLLHPRGCHGLAHAVITENGHQLWPTNPDGDYHGNGVPMEFDECHELKPPARLFLYTWNESVAYSHSVHVRITILPKWVAMPYLIVQDFIDIIKRLIGIE